MQTNELREFMKRLAHQKGRPLTPSEIVAIEKAESIEIRKHQAAQTDAAAIVTKAVTALKNIAAPSEQRVRDELAVQMVKRLQTRTA